MPYTPSFCFSSLFHSLSLVIGEEFSSVRKRETETETELKELVFEETHGTKREKERVSFLMGFDELDSFFMIITER